MYRVKGADEKEYGPVGADQVRLWSREGRLNRHSLLQKEGEGQWKPLEQFPEFADLVASPAPVVPPTVGAVTTPVTGASVKAPAILMIVTAGLSLLYAIYSLVMIFQVPIEDILKQAESQMGSQFPVQAPVAVVRAAILITGAMPILLGAIILFAGIRFLSLRNRGLVMAGSILLMVPCCGVSGPICFLALPVGIWSLLVISRPEIRAAFR